ncbi:helix-turn-helix domain-containing protein [Desulfofalx alkaliphila]|uniref:helix-turn-helix domain-containing protein n=1 Tax=Desulfofalx alkaliphila TaxID=105483 RepID=UPI0004E19D29|nr:helix-turn-helix domain-containing protein [Desulfofalx alkaliphila]
MALLSSSLIGMNIRKARMNKSAEIGFGYTKKMLADDLNENVHIVNVLESGRFYPDYEHLQKISKICGVTMEFLVGEEFEGADDYYKAIHEATKDNACSITRENKRY